MSSCNCGCTDSVTSLQGETGADGTSIVLATAPRSGIAAYEALYTSSRLSTSTDDIWNGGSGYTWSIMTVPAVDASNVMTISLTAQINATDVHIVTATLLVNGVALPNTAAIQSCGTRESLAWNVQTSGLTEGQTIAIKLLSDSAIVTAQFKNGLAIVNLYA